MSDQKTALYDVHQAHGAKMVSFANFLMPISYSSIKEEVAAVRENAGVFDVSHMGEFLITGPQAVDYVDYLMTNDFRGAGQLKAVYSPLCRDDGTIIDDFIAYKLADDKVLVCVNAANIEKDWNWFESHTKDFDIKLENVSDNYSLLAVQGPKTEEVLTKLELLNANEEFPYYSIKEKTWKDGGVILARTGYTGEDGFEVFLDHNIVKEVWELLLQAGVKPCGLASRDVLRLEVCYPLYGNELSDHWTPLDSGLKWTVKLSKENFIAKQALTDYEVKHRLIKLSLEKGIPREGYAVLNEQGDVVGKITSGTMSTTLGYGICLALIDKQKAPENKKYFIEIRGKQIPANYHTKPFLTGGHK